MIIVDFSSIAGLFNTKTLLYGAIFIMLITTIVLLFALAAHTTYVELREERFKRLRSIYEEAILKKLSGSDSKIRRPRRKVEFDALVEALSHMLTDASAEDEERLKDYARELGVVEFYTNMVGSRSWLKRFIAIEKLGLLRLPEMGAVFYRVLERDKDLGVLAKAVWAISFVLDEGNLDVINRVLDRPFFMSAKFSEYTYINIIGAFRRRGKEAKFVSYLKLILEDERISGALKRAIIEACGSAKLYSSKDRILSFARRYRDVPEARMTCLRALGELDAQDTLDMIRAGLSDTDWRVRAVAAKSASTCPEAIVKDLQTCLYDKHYSVRMNAALSLSRLGDKGLSALKHGTYSGDRFVRDVAEYMLKEVSLRA